MQKPKVWQLKVDGVRQTYGLYSLCVWKKNELISSGQATAKQCKIVPNTP